MVFKNQKQLENFLLKKCKAAVASAENKVYTEFAGNLNQFYSEFRPEEYIRTGALFDSLNSTGVQSGSNGASAKVYFTTPSYQRGAVPLQHTPEHGMYGNATWDGQTVLDVALTSGLPHGYYKDGTAIWSESMAALGDIDTLLINELKKQGL